MRPLLWLVALAGGALAAAPAVEAQEPPVRRDSLERRIATLEARLDSMQQLVGRVAPARPDTVAASDELAALRAQATALAGAGAPAPRADTVLAPSELRSRSLSRLNPEISVTADARVRAARPGPQQDNVDLREFAFGFQSALDPYSNTKIFASFGEHVEIEEAYVYWTGLPGGLRLDVGRFRQQAGELNRWHLHAVPGTEYPLVLREYFGHHGLVGDGIGLYAIVPVTSPGGGVHEVWGQVTLANNETLFGGGRRLSVLGHVNNFWQLTRATYLQLGATALYGENPDSALATRVLGGDVRLTWRPPERALYRSFTVRGEAFAVRRRVAGQGRTRFGGYVGAEVQLSRQAQVGARFDRVERLDGLARVSQGSLYLTWWQSEWVFLRTEWQHATSPGSGTVGGDTDRIVLQVVWSIGPHKHEVY
jgi:hypothetical protein